MKIKKILKEITPPIIVNAYRKAFSGDFNRNIWEGVYENYNDIPTVGDGYNGEEIANDTYINTISLLKKIEKDKISIQADIENFFLPIVVSVLMQSKKKVKILDFGGGMGIGYIYLINNISNKTCVDYFIIENESMCKGGTKIFYKEKQLHFVSEIPRDLPELDIVYMCSSLQYIENYKDLLEKLMYLNPKYFLFTKLSAGNIPTYATSQKNLYNSLVPYWFININEIIEIMNKGKYSLQYKSLLPRVYNQDNFPEEYRLENACNLLFKKI